jgi:enoyl-CoA hydratase/carnithine racemase
MTGAAWPREVGSGNAMPDVLTGDEWDANEAYRLNLVQAVTPPGNEHSGRFTGRYQRRTASNVTSEGS